MTRTSLKLVPTFPALNGTSELLEMLSFRRPAWTKTEEQFIDRFIRPHGVHEDAFGNLSKRVGTSPVLWSSHTDTVHTQGGRQRIRLLNGTVTIDDPQSNCLGADCTAGVWLMLEMIRANRPGLYVFHRAEEIGGKGSSFIAASRASMLDGIKYAVAFDRRGTKSIITHQWGGRCCSEDFITSFADALGMHHVGDDGGSFTDTANYTDIIGECSNLSVGYMAEHTKRESLNFNYLQEVRDALLKLDPADLVASRKPGELDPDDYGYDPCGDVTLWGENDQEPASWQEPRFRSVGPMSKLLRDHPDEVADWLEEYGISADEVATAIYMRGGVLRK